MWRLCAHRLTRMGKDLMSVDRHYCTDPMAIYSDAIFLKFIVFETGIRWL
jgi:hypothetical protein